VPLGFVGNPNPGSSVAMRTRPGCAEGPSLAALVRSYFRAISLRCQASSVAGVTMGVNSGKFLQHMPAQFLGSDRQAPTLVVAKPQSRTSELLAQHAILFPKIVDDVLLLLVQPSRQGRSATIERDRALGA
jgi:hypothetical protein